MNRHNVRVLRDGGSAEVERLARRLGTGGHEASTFAARTQRLLVRVDDVPPALVDVVAQAAEAVGGRALAGRAADGVRDGPQGAAASPALLLSASEDAVADVVLVLRGQGTTESEAVAEELADALRRFGRPREPLALRDGTFRWGERTYVMGVLNATPDSFSGDGLLATAHGDAWVRLAVERGLGFLADGADILDVGGQSTRPGAAPLDAETERARVVPVIEALRRETEAPISVDTYRASVARAALDAGADVVNDVWGLQMDPDLAGLVAERRVPVVIMHNRSKPRDAAQEARLGGRYVGVRYDDLLGDVIRELRAQVGRALEAGVAEERIIVDPGIGFGKTVNQNLYLLSHLHELRVLGYPILLGPSRKSFIGYTLDLPPEERVEGTAATVAVGILRGADMVRVHDVREMARVVRMTDATLRAEGE